MRQESHKTEKNIQTGKTQTGKKSVFSSKRFKYGSVAVIFTVVFVAFIILLNAVFTAVADYNGGFYLDLTGEKIYNLSESTASVLDSLNRKVEIIFCVSEDRVSDSEELSYVKRLAEKYRSASNRISLVYRDVVKDPLYFNQFKKTSTDTISQTSVIVNCPETKRYIVYPLVRFFKLSSETRSIFAYDGENKLTGAIMQTAIGEPQKAGFITGHGEEKRSSVETLLREQGYEVSDVDLKAVTEEQLASYNLLIVSNPKYDYTGIAAAKEGRVNEIGLLNTYLTKNYGNLMVFISPETPQLAELSSFLSDDWGISFVPGDIAVEGSSQALDADGVYFLGTPSSEDSYGKSIHASVTETGVQAVFGNAAPLSLTFTEKGEKTVSVVYATSSSSGRLHEGSISAEGNMPVMTLSVYSKIYDSNEYRANVLVCGSADFMNYVSEQSFANADILKSTFAVMGNTNVVTGIRYKVVEDTAITVTQENFKNYTVLLSVLVPLVIAALGTVMYIKRKKA